MTPSTSTYTKRRYNALLGSTDIEGKNFYYDNPLDQAVARYAWHVCPCCVGNIPRTLLMMPTWVYAKAADGVYVNMFVGSTINLENVGGTDVEMVQATDYPWNGNVSLTVNPKAQKRFSLRIRVPNRNVSALYKASPEVGGLTSIAVNGSAVKPKMENGYAVIARNWKAGDKVELVLPLGVQRVKPSDKIEATRGKVALRYGALIYNIEAADQDITKALSPNSPLTTEWRKDFLGGVMVIKGQFADGSPMLAIPNFVRANRVPPTPVPPVNAPPEAGAPRPAPRAPISIVWIKEA